MTAEVFDAVATKELEVSNQIEIPAGADIIESNGSENVTISNVAPANVGTATIARWLKVRNAGVDYYIPMWT